MSPLLDKLLTVVIGAAAGFAASWYVHTTNNRLLAVEDVNDYQGQTILQIIEHVESLEEYVTRR